MERSELLELLDRGHGNKIIIIINYNYNLIPF